MRHLIGTLFAVIAAAACGVTTPENGPDQPLQDPGWAYFGSNCSPDSPTRSLSAAARDSLPPPRDGLDTQWAAIALRVPGGWGGFFRENGVPTIYLADPAKREAAIAALEPEGIPVTSSTIVKQGRWGLYSDA